MKGLQNILSIRNIKTLQSVGARGIPKIQRSNYLELYTLNSEKERQEKNILALEKRRDSALNQLENIRGRIATIQKETPVEQKAKTFRDAPTKPLRTMPIHY